MDTFDKTSNAGATKVQPASHLILLDEVQKANVLILEDEVLMSSLLIRYIDGIAGAHQLKGVQVASLNTGWELLKKDLSHVRVAVIDLLLPQVTGVDLIRDFRHRFPKMGLVAISGMATAPMKRSLKELLPQGFELLEKPLRKEAFIEAFIRAWHYAEQQSHEHLPKRPAKPAAAGGDPDDESPMWSASITNTEEVDIIRRRSMKKKAA